MGIRIRERSFHKFGGGVANRHQVLFRRETGGPLRTSIFFPRCLPLFLELSLHLGPDHLVLAYLDDIFILGRGGGELQQVNAFLSDRRSPLSLNPAKCWEQRLDDLRDNGAEILGSLIGPRDSRPEPIPTCRRKSSLRKQLCTVMDRKHQEKVARLPPQGNTRATGESIGDAIWETIKGWKASFSRGAFDFLMRRMSVALSRARGRTFTLVVDM